MELNDDRLRCDRPNTCVVIWKWHQSAPPTAAISTQNGVQISCGRSTVICPRFSGSTPVLVAILGQAALRIGVRPDNNPFTTWLPLVVVHWAAAGPALPRRTSAV